LLNTVPYPLKRFEMKKPSLRAVRTETVDQLLGAIDTLLGHPHTPASDTGTIQNGLTSSALGQYAGERGEGGVVEERERTNSVSAKSLFPSGTGVIP